MIVKVTSEDLTKLVKTVMSSRYATYVNVDLDGQRIRFTFEDDNGKLVTVTLFDTGTKVSPTVTRTESL
jgi:hypothetical protein